MKEKDKLMTVPEVCQQLRISRRTLYRLLKTGRLPAFKVGHEWRFTYDSVHRYFMALAQQVPHLYKVDVLDKYRADLQRYQLTERETDGEIRLRPENLARYTKEGYFEVIRYTYRIWNQERVVRLMPHELAVLPYDEYLHWDKFVIKFEYHQL